MKESAKIHFNLNISMLALFLGNLSYQEIAAPSLKQLFIRRRDKAMEISRK